MPRFRIDPLGALCRQLPFSPRPARESQIQAAEELLHLVDSNRTYPLDFVIFKITGYRRRNASQELLAGAALQHDLGLLIECISQTLDLQSRKLSEPVLTIDDLTGKLAVTSKTIQRWRRRGLPARQFTFPDGKRRVGFLLSSVERFLACRVDQVARDLKLTVVGPAERREIIRRGRRLAIAGRCCPADIARRIGRKLGRSALTVQETLRKYDQENPADAILPRAALPLTQEQRAVILDERSRGLSLAQLAGTLSANRAAVARVLLEERIARLARRRVRFIDDPLYHQPDADSAIAAIAGQEELASAPAATETRVPRDLPPNLLDLYRTPLLSPARERALFLKLNYEKFKFASARRKIDIEFARARDLRRLESLHRAVTDTRNLIVSANLRLVASVARKHMRPSLNLTELVSEGNVILLRAVESFDVHRGNRFSTYATLALMKGFARAVPLIQKGSAAAQTGRCLDTVADRRLPAPEAQLAQRDQISHLLGRLDERERCIVRSQYGLAGGQRLGLSVYRVRQIEKSAMAKLRAHAASAHPT